VVGCGTTGGTGGCTGTVDDVPWVGLGLADFVGFFDPDGEGDAEADPDAEADAEADGLPPVSVGAGAAGSLPGAEVLSEAEAPGLGR
jgi:hypothetical protein